MEEGDYDMIIDTKINADVARVNLFNPIIIAEDDENSHRLIAQLQVNGEDLNIALIPGSSAMIRLNYVRADGMVGYQNGSFNNGRVQFVLPNAMFELDDIVKCDIVYAYTKEITTHALSVHNRELVVDTSTGITQCPLRTALFYIDSQLRVITEYEGGEI